MSFREQNSLWLGMTMLMGETHFQDLLPSELGPIKS